MPSDTQTVLGVDVGGTKVNLGVVNAQGEITCSHRHPTHPEHGVDQVIADIADGIRECLHKAQARVAVIGIGVSGQVDVARGIVRFAPNLPDWHDVPLQRRLEEALGLPIAVGNDLNLIALAEWRFGSGRGTDDLIVVFVGTGVGAGIVSGGRLLTGADGYAGELGHTTLVANGRRCHCGRHGCLEAYVGGWAIAERAREQARQETADARHLVHTAGGTLQEISAASVGDARRGNNRLAADLLEETGRYLGLGLASLVNLFNPRRLILGGGVIDGNPDLVDRVRDIIRSQALYASVEHLTVAKGELGANAGVIGAAYYAQTAHPADPQFAKPAQAA